MLKAFNAFQCVSLFALTPYALSWLAGQEFTGHMVAFCVGCVVYLASFVFMCAAVFSAFTDG